MNQITVIAKTGEFIYISAPEHVVDLYSLEHVCGSAFNIHRYRWFFPVKCNTLKSSIVWIE